MSASEGHLYFDNQLLENSKACQLPVQNEENQFYYQDNQTNLGDYQDQNNNESHYQSRNYDDEQLRMAVQYKKEKFRVEIRKKKLNEEITSRRMKISSINDTRRLQEQVEKANNNNNTESRNDIERTDNNGNITNTINIAKDSQKKKRKNQYFSFEEANYEEELQVVYCNLMEGIGKHDFDYIEELLMSLFHFIQDDQKPLGLKIPKIIQSGIVVILGELLSEQFDKVLNSVNLVLEIICNLTAGSPMQNIKIFQLAMLNKTLLNFLGFTLNHNIIDSALHIITHYFCDATPPRNQLKQQNLIPKLIEIYKKQWIGLYTQPNKAIYGTYTWCLSNVVSDPSIELSEILELNEVAHELFLMSQDEETTRHLLWYFRRTTQHSSERLPIILASDNQGNVRARLVKLLMISQDHMDLSLLAFKVISNILENANESIIIQLLEFKLLDGLQYVLKTSIKNISNAAAVFWAISNILVVSNTVIKYVLAHPIFEEIIAAAKGTNDQRKIEAINCLCNLQSTSNYQQITAYVAQGIFQILVEQLEVDNTEKSLLKVIEALTCSLFKAAAVGEIEQLTFLETLENYGLSQRIDNMQVYPSQIVFEAAADFIETFYPPQ